MSGYRKIIHENGHTPHELLDDLQKRSTHYAKKAERLAKRKLRLDHRLAIIEAVLAASLTVTLALFHATLLENRLTTAMTLMVSSTLSLVAIIRKFGFDARLSAQTLAVSQQFYEVREAVKSLRTEASVKGFADEDLRGRYESINARYGQLREKFVEYVAHHVLYYGASTGPGSLRVDVRQFEKAASE